MAGRALAGCREGARCATSASSTLSKKGQLTFVIFHILGSSISSLNEIEDTAGFADDASYFLVKNFINDTSFFEWDQATLFFVFQEIQGRGRDHHSQTQ
jgi:hypothetical protein